MGISVLRNIIEKIDMNMFPRKLASVYFTVLNFQLMINIDEKEVLLGILPEGYSYHYIEIEC